MRRFATVARTKTFTVLFITLVAAGGVLLKSLGFAATGQMYLSPGSTSVQVGSNFTVSIRINPGGSPVYSVTSTLTYDQSRLQFVSVDPSGSNFSIEAPTSPSGGGHVYADRANVTPVAADALIVRVTFKALVGSGSTAISLAGNSNSGGQTGNDPATAGATISFTSPVTPPPPSPPPSKATPPSQPPKTPGPSSPSPAPSPKPGSPSPTPALTATPPTPEKPNCKTEVRKVQFTVATIHVTCTPAARAFVKYGVEGKLIGSTAPTGGAAGEFGINLSGQVMRPGSKVSYSLVAIGATGEQVEGAVQSFSTKGYTIKVKALDKNQKPLANRQFTLHSDPISGKSDGNGVITFANIAPGKHTLELTGKDKFTQELTVNDTVGVAADGTQYAGVQNFSVSFNRAKAGSGVLRFVTGIVLVLAIIGAGLWVFITRNGGSLPPGLSSFRKGTFKKPEMPGTNNKVITGSGGPGETSHIAPPPEVIVPQTQISSDKKEDNPHVG